LENKIIRVSSTTTDGQLAGTAAAAIAAADGICGVGYKALIANSSRNTTTDWPLAPNQRYVRNDGTTVIGTTNSSGVFTFNLTNAISGSAANVWTGVFSNWGTGTNCTNWTTNAGGVSAQYGLATSFADNAIAFTSSACNNQYYLYCVEQ
jgi:hypothetical protein